MEQQAFLLRVVKTLEDTGISYAVTGSWASITYGLPRTTHDIDLIVALPVEKVPALAAAFPPPIYADLAWMTEAAAAGEFFNIIDPTLGLKVDFWPLRSDEYAQVQFGRRRREQIASQPVWMLTPEDIILAKLLWYQMSTSERQWQDIVGVWKVQQNRLDLGYLTQWVKHLNLGDLYEKLTAA